MTSVRGTFSRGEVIAVRDAQGTLIGRGIARYSSREVELVRGMRLDMVARVIPEPAPAHAPHPPSRARRVLVPLTART